MTSTELCLVYRAVNKTNGHYYIGCTSKGLQYRKGRHFASARHGSRLFFHNALRKYGQDSFEFSVLEFCDSFESALTREAYYISILKPRYNLTKGGVGASGYKHRPVSLEKMSKQRLGCVGPWKGKKRDPRVIEAMRLANLANPTRYWLGKVRSPETNAKISKTKRANVTPRKCIELLNAHHAKAVEASAVLRRKMVRCVDDKMSFESAVAASKYYGANSCSVARAIRRNGRLFGKRFEYVGAA